MGVIKIAGEGVVTVSATGQTSVEIWTTKLDHNTEKPIVNIPIPRQKASMDAEDTPSTYLIDIGRVKEVISIQGMLIDDATTSAQERKTNLLKIIYYERSCTISWGTGSRAQTYTGNINKVMITETPGIIGEQKTNYESEKNFAIQFSLMVGEEK